MKRLGGLLVVLAMSSVAWTDAHADFLFASSLVCDSDNDGSFGTATDATGRVQITPAGVTPPGAFKLIMSGLPPGTQAFCTFTCVISGGVPVQFFCGIANASGRISFTAPAVIDPAVFCPVPAAAVNLTTGGVCVTGWGAGTPVQ